jgi:hypothetical protein
MTKQFAHMTNNKVSVAQAWGTVLYILYLCYSLQDDMSSSEKSVLQNIAKEAESQEQSEAKY